MKIALVGSSGGHLTHLYLLKKFGKHVIAGFKPTAYAKYNFEDCLVPNILTKRKNHLQLVKESDICITTTGLHRSIGWKFAEYIATNKTYIFSISAIVGAVSNVVMNLAFIPTFGVIGAILALVLCELLVISYQLYSIREEIPTSDLFHGIWKYIVAGSIVCCCS